MTLSQELFKRALKVIPGGVNSPVRAFTSVGGDPVYVTSGKGARVTTVEGKVLVDFCGSWGPLILGHAHDKVVAAISQAAEKGTSFGINTQAEVDMAELLCRLVPSMDMVRLVSSGTEAVMTAIRLARGYTGRSKIIKFTGGYHGHSDSLLVAAGSGLLTGGMSSSAGVSESVALDTFVPDYNDLEAVQNIAESHGDDLAAIIIEPVAGNMGLVEPEEGFLEGLRDIAERTGALLIFDEVITGFRLAPTSRGELVGVTPDLTTLGKIIGGGMPIGAIGGKREIMEKLAPLGPVYQAGTLSGNPVAVAAGLATLTCLENTDPYPEMARLAKRLTDSLNDMARKHGVPVTCVQLGGMFTPFFGTGKPRNLDEVKACDCKAHARFFHGMLSCGFYLPPSQFEVAFVSAAHRDEDVDAFLNAADGVLAEMGREG